MNKGKVVVIDDSPVTRRLVMAILSEEGYQVYSAEDGEEGIKLAEEVSPSIILVDFIMPRMNGYQFCKMVRDNQSLKDVPILLITSKGEKTGLQFRKKFLCDYLIKPIEAAELVEKVNSIVQPQQTAEILVQEERTRAMQDSGINKSVLEEIPVTPGIEESMEKINTYVQSQQAITAPEQDEMTDEVTPEETDVTPDIEKAVEKAIQRYFHKEFRSLLQTTIANAISYPRTSNIILSGELADFNILDILQLSDTARLIGKLSVYSSLISYEIYFDRGSIVYISTSKEGSDMLLNSFLEERKNIPKETLDRVRRTSKGKGFSVYRTFIDEGILSKGEITAIFNDYMSDAILSIMGLSSGSFFFEKITMPPDLSNTPIKFKPSQLILEGVRRVAKRSDTI